MGLWMKRSLRGRGRPVHLQLEVGRRDLERLVAPLIEGIIELCQRALADAGISAEQIARVCLVGGATRIPLVRQRLEEVFSAVVHEDIDPDLAVGLGASLQAGLLRGSQVERILVDVTAHSLGVKVVGQHDDPDFGEADTFAPVLKRNTGSACRPGRGILHRRRGPGAGRGGGLPG
jgi:molecular chaperone DnaK